MVSVMTCMLLRFLRKTGARALQIHVVAPVGNPTPKPNSFRRLAAWSFGGFAAIIS